LRLRVANVAREVLPADAANLVQDLCPRRRNQERGGPMKTMRERAAEQREVKLELVREQVESGALVIRKMTVEERRRYPSRPAPPKRSGKR
jgi:hypothetical protein